MTCIVGIETDRGVVVGGDSAGVSGLNLTVRADSKAFVRDDFVFGFTSSFRMGQLLRYAAIDFGKHRPTDGDARGDPDRWMSTHFIDAVRATLKAGGYARVDSGVESGGCFLVGFAGRLYQVESDFQVGRSALGYEAVGCGGNIAVGAMYAARGRAEDRVRTALEAAEQFSAGVRGPFHLVTGGQP